MAVSLAVIPPEGGGDGWESKPGFGMQCSQAISVHGVRCFAEASFGRAGAGGRFWGWDKAAHQFSVLRGKV